MALSQVLRCLWFIYRLEDKFICILFLSWLLLCYIDWDWRFMKLVPQLTSDSLGRYWEYFCMISPRFDWWTQFWGVKWFLFLNWTLSTIFPSLQAWDFFAHVSFLTFFIHRILHSLCIYCMRMQLILMVGYLIESTIGLFAGERNVAILSLC